MSANKWMPGLALLLILSFVYGSGTVFAHEKSQTAPVPEPEETNTLPGNPYQPQRDPGGRWIASTHWIAPGDNRPQAVAATGGPDQYGYVWDNSAPLSWIDASGGVDLGLSRTTDQSGPVELGFSFKYYENIYSQLFVSLHGVLGFANEDLSNLQSSIPSSPSPNTLIAPYWAPVDGVGGYVRYLRGGDAPNRWFVVEWNRVQADSMFADEMDEYSFEAILHENGDIAFQYGEMRIGGTYYLCQISGIEDSSGLDGLEVTDFCTPIASNHAVHITRPAPAARLSILSRGMGRFARAGEQVRFTAQIRNTGELGTDTYEISATLSNPDWQIALFQADGVTPISDTNGVSGDDTGPVAQGDTIPIVVAIQVSNPVNVGDATQVELELASALDPGKIGVITLLAAIPTNFAQAYADQFDGTQRVLLVRPDRQMIKRSSNPGAFGWNGGVNEAPNGYLWTTWEKNRCLGSNCQVAVNELEYAILNHAGNFTRLPGKLTDHSSATRSIHDYSASSAAAPNGAVGVFWRRISYNENWAMNTNLYFAVLDSAGNVTMPAVNITNEQDYGDTATRFFQPRIAATGDNRFVMTWYTYDYTTGAVRDVYFAIRDWQNTPIAEGKLTADTPGNDLNYVSPTVTSLDNNRVLVAFSQFANQVYTTAYVVLDSAGNLVKPLTTIPGTSFGMDGAQISPDRIMLAWTSYDTSTPKISYVILNGSGYDVIFGPATLDNPVGRAGDDYVSVTHDQAGRAVLTWTDSSSGGERNLYYSLIDPDGAVITPPVVFYTGQAETSYDGQGNTTFTMAPTAVQVDAYVDAPSLIGAPPAASTLIPIQFGNLGARSTSEISITATLDSNLSYVSDNLGIAPDIVGNTLTWTIPGELAYLGYGTFNLVVTVPDAAIGTRYPVELTIISAGPDDVPGNNTKLVEVMVAEILALPMVMAVP